MTSLCARIFTCICKNAKRFSSILDAHVTRILPARQDAPRRFGTKLQYIMLKKKLHNLMAVRRANNQIQFYFPFFVSLHKTTRQQRLPSSVFTLRQGQTQIQTHAVPQYVISTHMLHGVDRDRLEQTGIKLLHLLTAFWLKI